MNPTALATFAVILAPCAAISLVLCTVAAYRGYDDGAEGRDLHQGGLPALSYMAGRWARRRRDGLVRRALATPLRTPKGRP